MIQIDYELILRYTRDFYKKYRVQSLLNFVSTKIYAAFFNTGASSKISKPANCRAV